MAASKLHPIQKRVFAKGLALKELRPYIRHLCDLKDKVAKIAVDAGMHPEDLLNWVQHQFEFTSYDEDDSEQEATEEEDSEETSETEET